MDEVNHEIISLNKKYNTSVSQDGLSRITNPADRTKLDKLVKMKNELEENLHEA